MNPAACDRNRYAIAGTGVRSLCFARAILGAHASRAALVGLYDLNVRRMQGFNNLLGVQTPAFTDFATMVQETRPSHLIIGTPDHTHADMIRLAFEHGLDAIVEKPMATEAGQVRRILALERRHGRRIRVAFNYRYVPYAARLREVLQSGKAGRPLSVSLDWHLDKVHGAEYFRRWHATMANSGGLLVHKASHHFDLVNWLLGDEPEEVTAFGGLHVYGRNGPFRGERCSTCPHAAGACPFVMTLHTVEKDKAIFDELYWNAEAEDGYIRDRCVFREDIDIYDTMSVAVRYKGGAQLSYSLNAYSPVEGYDLHITGAEARVEASERHAGVFMQDTEDVKSIVLHRGRGRGDLVSERLPVEIDRSEHGGGDNRMYRHLFEPDTSDPLGQAAGSRAGAMSCLVGIAANRSIMEKKPVRVDDLLRHQQLHLHGDGPGPL